MTTKHAWITLGAVAVIVVVSAWIAGCSGGFGGTLPSPGAGGINLPPDFHFLGIALVGRPEGRSSTGSGTDISVVRGLNTATPTATVSDVIHTDMFSVDVFAVSNSAKVGVVDGEDRLSVIRGLDTATPTVTAPIPAPDGGSASGVMVNNDDKTGLLAGADGVHRLLDLDLATFSIGPALPGGFRTGNDTMVYTPDHKTAIIGSAGHGFSSGNRSSIQIVRAADTATPTVGPTITLPGSDGGFEGFGGMCVSPADPTRMTVATSAGVVLITGLNTATPTVGAPVPIPTASLPTGFDGTPSGTAISRDGKRVAVLTFQGVMMFDGVDTGTLAPVSNFLTLDATGVQENGNLGVTLALDGKAVYVNNNHTETFYVVTGINTSTIAISVGVPLVPSELGRQDDNAFLLH